MTEASRVQKLLSEQNAEIDRLKNHIKKLESANLKQTCIKINDEARIEKLEAALRSIACANDPDDPCTCLCQNECSYGIARQALEGKL